MSLSEQTFHAVVADLVDSLLRGGFRRIVLLPTHGGNFAPLARGLEMLDAAERARVVAPSPTSRCSFRSPQLGERDYGVPLADGGLHAGEWETSLLLALHPRAGPHGARRARYTGDLGRPSRRCSSGGVASSLPRTERSATHQR